MTNEQKEILDKKIRDFNSFTEFHKFANEHNIIFDIEEWDFYRTEMKKILSNKKTNTINVNLDNLILP